MARNDDRVTVWFEVQVFFKKGKPKTYTVADNDKARELTNDCKKNPLVNTVLTSRIEKRLYAWQS